MDDLALTSGVTSEFFKYLNGQLRDAREQLQRTTEENHALKEELRRLQCDVHFESTYASSNDHEYLRDEVNRLCKELETVRECAKHHEADAATWRTRYEQLKPQLVNSADRTAQLLETMREQLASSESQGYSSGQTLAQFRTLLHSLPGIVAAADPGASRVVFVGTKLPLLSKASVNACNGGFCFFGDFLKWSSSPSQHAYAIFPEYRYNPRPADEEPTWTPATEWASLAGQQRELLYVNDGNICYGGTFLCHAGPHSIKVEDFGGDIDESFVQALARKTFTVTSKNPQSRQAKAEIYVPLLADLYTEGTATVQILGLQRIGFNGKLFHILRRAYDKRDKKAQVASSTTPKTDAETEASPTPATRAQGRKRDLFLEFTGEPEEFGWDAPGPSKIPRLDEGAVLCDEMTVWRAG